MGHTGRRKPQQTQACPKSLRGLGYRRAIICPTGAWGVEHWPPKACLGSVEPRVPRAGDKCYLGDGNTG